MALLARGPGGKNAGATRITTAAKPSRRSKQEAERLAILARFDRWMAQLEREAEVSSNLEQAQRSWHEALVRSHRARPGGHATQALSHFYRAQGREWLRRGGAPRLTPDARRDLAAAWREQQATKARKEAERHAGAAKRAEALWVASRLESATFGGLL